MPYLQNLSDSDLEILSTSLSKHQLNETNFAERYKQWSFDDVFVNRPLFEQPSPSTSVILTDEVIKRAAKPTNLLMKGKYKDTKIDLDITSEKQAANNGVLFTSPIKLNIVYNDWMLDERQQQAHDEGGPGLPESQESSIPLSSQEENNITYRRNKLRQNSPVTKRKLTSDRSPDRYIPRTLYRDAAHCHEMGESSSVPKFKRRLTYNIESEDPILLSSSPFKKITCYQTKIANACGIDLKTRILQFKPLPPRAHLSGKKAFSSLYDYESPAWHKNYATDGGIPTRYRRRILTSPIRVLDAPSIIDDFYRNLLSWSYNNVVALALEDSVYLWNANNGKTTQLIEHAQSSISSVSWSEDATNLAVGMEDGIIEIWDTEEQKRIRSMRLNINTAVCVLDWNNHLLTSGSRHPSIWNHDVRIAQHRIMEYQGHASSVCGLQWKSDGIQLASGGNDNLLNIWDIRSNVARFTRTAHKSAVRALAWCPWKSDLLASGGGCNDRQLHFWNTTSGTRLKTVNSEAQVTSLRWSLENKEIVSTHGFPNNNIIVWNYTDLAKLVDITAHDSRVLHCALSPDGTTLATAAADENLKFWKLFQKSDKPKGVPMDKGGTIAKVANLR